MLYGHPRAHLEHVQLPQRGLIDRSRLVGPIKPIPGRDLVIPKPKPPFDNVPFHPADLSVLFKSKSGALAHPVLTGPGATKQNPCLFEKEVARVPRSQVCLLFLLDFASNAVVKACPNAFVICSVSHILCQFAHIVIEIKGPQFQ